jgi:hypothetical protein
VKAELRDFRGLEERPGRAKGVLAAFILAAAIGGVAYAFYFGVPHHVDIPAESAGTGVQRIDVSGTAALVTVTADWVANADANLPKLVQVLRARKIAKAILTLQTGKSAGIVDVPSGKATGLPRPAPAAVQP